MVSDMSNEPQLFRVEPENWESERIEEVDFSFLGFQERRDIQEWVAANPGILGEDLLIIGKEFSGFDRTNERLDLLAVDYDGKLVIIELKRDDTGADAHWQAIKYASYLHRTGADTIVRMLANHAEISQGDAELRLLQHIDADDLNALNNDQRIILASHRFAPEVTSAALWLNAKVPDEDLITCVRLTPHRDTRTDTLYVQATTIIPVPRIDGYLVGVGSTSNHEGLRVGNTFAANLQATYDRNKNDDVTHFLRDKVSTMVLNKLDIDVRPDMKSRWAGQHGAGEGRYFHFWYRNAQWANWGTSYRVNLWRQEDEDYWEAILEFRHQLVSLDGKLIGLKLEHESRHVQDGIVLELGIGKLNDEFAEHLAQATSQLIEQVTPLVNQLEDESNEVEA